MEKVNLRLCSLPLNFAGNPSQFIFPISFLYLFKLNHKNQMYEMYIEIKFSDNSVTKIHQNIKNDK